jgi:polyferredoxin
MPRLKKLEMEIEKIKERNRRVESDKSWETSWSRKLVVSVATYFVIALFLLVSKILNPWTSALVPTIAFVLSTLSIPFFKKLWLKHVYKRN